MQNTPSHERGLHIDIRQTAFTAKDKPLDVLCFSHLRWHFVTQRPQHLLTRCARLHRVFFWEEPYFDVTPGTDPHLEVIEEGSRLWILRPHLVHGGDPDLTQQMLLRKFMFTHDVSHYLSWYYTPLALSFTGELKPEVTVYDCMDELANFLDAPRDLVKFEQVLLAKADVVFTGGMSLYESKRTLHPNVHAFPSSIDVDHFAKATGELPEPPDQASIPAIRAGFYGVLDERFDFGLLRELAELRPEIQFILIGPIAKISRSVLPERKNIHYLGSKSYEELPVYLAGWDVALLPFAMNQSTRYISPTKTPEYLAAGKPVISTPIQDVVSEYGKSGLVAIASSAEEFAEALDRALGTQSEDWRASVKSKLSTTSWDLTWSNMWKQVERVHPRHVVRQTEPVSSFRMAPTSVRIRPVRSESLDYLIVGAGLAGSVLAERLANGMGKRVLLIDKRCHIAGNTYDHYDAAGILVHKYGPHIFHTNSMEVVRYLSQFTEWHDYEHRVLASVCGQLVPIPINIDTINRLYGLSLDASGMQRFLESRVESRESIRSSEDIVVSRVGRDLYEKFFRNYTRKQWGLDPSELDASVAGRIPVRFNNDDRYFTDTFQAMPLNGYTRMVERMLDSSNITVSTGTDYTSVARSYPNARVVFTGPVDEYFDFRYGPLPYRSLEFRHETHDREWYQKAAVLNYPNEHEYTRVTEFKYLTGQVSPKTSVVFEYPKAEGDPYYPIPRPENALLYLKYKMLAERQDEVQFVGRLATYKYYNMDQVVAQALVTYRKLLSGETSLPVGKSSSQVLAGASL